MKGRQEALAMSVAADLPRGAPLSFSRGGGIG